MAGWNVKINDFLGGFAPAWYKETYPSYGNPNMAGDMTNIDLTNPGYLTQGPGTVALTNGTQAAAVTTLIKGMLDQSVSSGTTYGTGGAKLYQFTNTAVANAGSWPHTIDKAAVTGEDGEDVAYYQGALYYSYNYTGGGDVGKFDLSSTFDDDWGSTTPTGAAALQNAPHPMVVAGNDYLYIANARYVTSYDGSEFIEQALDLPQNTEIVDMKWMADRLWITANRPNLESATDKDTASIFVWDGTTNSWEIEIPLPGTAGASHVKNGTLFQFYKDNASTSGIRLGYVSGGGIVEVASFDGALPQFYQTTEYKGFILFVSGTEIFVWGSGDKDLPVQLFNIADIGLTTTAGGLVCPFGTPIIASNATTNYQLAKFSGYDTNSGWKSMLFDITGDGRRSAIDYVRINFETLATGARVDWSLVNNQGTTIYSDTISNAKFGASTTTAWYPIGGKQAENFRVQFDFSNGSATNPVKIKNVRVYGSSE